VYTAALQHCSSTAAPVPTRRHTSAAAGTSRWCGQATASRRQPPYAARRGRAAHAAHARAGHATRGTRHAAHARHVGVWPRSRPRTCSGGGSAAPRAAGGAAPPGTKLTQRAASSARAASGTSYRGACAGGRFGAPPPFPRCTLGSRRDSAMASLGGELRESSLYGCVSRRGRRMPRGTRGSKSGSMSIVTAHTCVD
jgi:hypothetical protein